MFVRFENSNFPSTKRMRRPVSVRLLLQPRPPNHVKTHLTFDAGVSTFRRLLPPRARLFGCSSCWASVLLCWHEPASVDGRV